MITRYEPPIVTTLRRYWRRGASPTLLLRLAGGVRDWGLLNESWNIDGTRPPSGDKPAGFSEVELGEPIALSCPERRIALTQISGEAADHEVEMPTMAALGLFFGVTRHQIRVDLEALRNRGDIDWVLVSDGCNGVRRKPLRIAEDA